MASIKKVGFIGTGNMGQPMATNLLKAGFEVAVYDVSRDKAAPLLDLGARWADSPADCAREASAVLTSLPGPKEVTAVLRGDSGLLLGMAEGATWIDLSTNDTAVLKALAAELAEKGVTTLDAPVTGGVDGARAGTLTIMLGGEAVTYEAMLPLFDAISAKVFHMGPLGAGMVAKLIVQQLYYVHVMALGEALTLGVGSGCDSDVLWQLLKKSVADSYAVQHDVPAIFEGHYDPSFTLDLTIKDLLLVQNLTESFSAQGGAKLALTKNTTAIYEEARKQFGGSAGWLSVVRWLEDASGVKLNDRSS